MKVLVTGRSGQVGRELVRALPDVAEVIATRRDELDLSRPHEIVRRLHELRPDLIINAAAYTAVDRAEEEPDEALAVNAHAPRILGEEAARMGVPVVHYSTDYVFDGEKAAPYEEADRTAPLNVYGRTKLLGERGLRASGAAHLIFRVAWVYGSGPANFLATMLKLFAERDTVRVVADELGAPTWSRDIARGTIAALRAVGGDPRGWTRSRLASALRERGGLYHLAPSGETSWYGFAAEIRRLAEASDAFTTRVSSLVAIPAREWPSAARRPRNSRLSSGALASALGVRLPDWRNGVESCLREIAATREVSAV